MSASTGRSKAGREKAKTNHVQNGKTEPVQIGSKNQPTAEQLRIAQLTSSDIEPELTKKINQVSELTGRSKDEALTALHDCDYDPNRAVEILFERQDNQTEEWQVSSKKKKTTVGVKGNQVGGGGESVADSLGSRSDLVLTSSEQDKSEHDRSGDSMPRGRRERSGPPRFHRGRGYSSANGEKGGSSSRERPSFESGRGSRRRGAMSGGGRNHIGRGFSSGRGNFEMAPHIDTWTNEKTVNGDKDVSIGDWGEDWGADEFSGSLEESRVFTASSSLANATIYNSMCPATTAASTASIFDQASIGAQTYVTGSTAATSHTPASSVDSRASVLTDSASGNVYRSSTMPLPPGSLSSHASLSSGYDLNMLLQQQQKLTEPTYEQSAAYLRYTQEATEVIKNAVGIGSSSLGSHGSVGMDQMSHGLGSSPSAMQNSTSSSVVKQPARPRMPPPSRIPASAVEMPASMNSAQLDVQFGNWDAVPAAGVPASAESASAISFTADVASQQQAHYGPAAHSISQGSSGLHGGSSMPGYDMSATRAAMMSVTVTEPAKPSLLMLDDLGMGGSAPKAVPPAAYSNNTNLSKDFINSKMGHGQPAVAFPSSQPDRKASPYGPQAQQPTVSQSASYSSLTTQSAFSQVNTYAVSSDAVNSSSVYKAAAAAVTVSTAVTGSASFHSSSVSQYGSSFSSYPGIDGSVAGHTVAAASQYPSYAGTPAPGFAPQPQMGGSAGDGYGTVQTSQPVYGGSAHLSTSSKPYLAISTTAVDKQPTGMTSYQSAGLSQSYDVYQQLNSGQLASGGVTSSGSGYPLSGTAYQSGQLTYQGSSYQAPSVQGGYDLSAGTNQLSGSTSYGSGHSYVPNPYSRQSRDVSMPAGSYTSGPDGTSVPGYPPRGTQTYTATVPSSSAPVQSVSSTGNKLADSLSKLSVKDSTSSVSVSGQFDGTSSSTSATLSTTTTTASSAVVGFMSATAASSTTARATSSVLATKSSVPLTSKAVVSMPVGGPAMMNNYMIAQPPGFQLATFGYPPAQQPVTYTYEELQMMQQPQRFPVPYYDMPFHQPATTMTGRDVTASLTGQSYSAGGDTKLPAIDAMSPIAVQPAAVPAAPQQQQSNVAAAGSAAGVGSQQQQQQQSYLNPAAMHPAAAAAPTGYSYYYPSPGILPVGSYYAPMIQMGVGGLAVPLATNPAHGVTTATTQYQKAAMYGGSHAGYGVGGQTQDFTKTFASSQTANKGPAAGVTNDVLTGAASFNKTHVQAFDKGAFHSGTPPPPFNMALQSAAAQTGAALGGGYGAPYMPMVPHQSHSTQILHHPMSQDGRTAVQQSAGQQPKAGGVNKTPAGYSTGYWGSN